MGLPGRTARVIVAAMTGATYRLSAHQTLTVRRTGADTNGELLEVEAVWTPSADLPPVHLHPSQTEHFEVLEGGLLVVLDGTQRRLAAGAKLDIPAGTPHAMTAPDEPTRAVWQTRPALRTEEFFAAMDAALARGGSLMSYAPVFRAHGAEVRLSKPPAAVQGPLFAVLAAAGKLLRR